MIWEAFEALHVANSEALHCPILEYGNIVWEPVCL